MIGTPTLYIALELGEDKWLLACSTEAAQKPRLRGLPARDLRRLDQEIAKAKTRFGLPADTPVRTCYEAGRDGFWLHRALSARGIDNVVVDSGSIEVNRRSKHAKTDPIDAGKLLSLLCRYHGGERKVWSVVRVPAVADEDRRQLHRGLKDLQRQRTECSNRILGLLASAGLTAEVNAEFRATLAELRDWQDQAVPPGLRARILQEYAVWEALHRQERDTANEQERQLREGQEPYLDKVRRLMGLKAVGVRSAWILVVELFAWRGIRNGKELKENGVRSFFAASAAGKNKLTPFSPRPPRQVIGDASMDYALFPSFDRLRCANIRGMDPHKDWSERKTQTIP